MELLSIQVNNLYNSHTESILQLPRTHDIVQENEILVAPFFLSHSDSDKRSRNML